MCFETRAKMAKRSLAEEDCKTDFTVSDLKEASPKAKVHCVVTSLSPSEREQRTQLLLATQSENEVF